MDIVKNRKIYMGISLIIIIVGFIMFLINGFNYGIEFTGGSLIEIDAGKFISAEDVGSITDEFDENMSIVHGGEDKHQLILRSTKDLSNTQVNKIADDFVEEHEIDRKNFSAEKVGASMGAELRNKALLSIVIATMAMLIYISIRFEFKFGLAAIIALIDDVLVVLSFFTIFNLPVEGSFIAAILTIVGYSINDTIVIFDRIREELKINPREKVENIINNGINYSMRRTINTTITTILAVAVLYFVGVESIKILALPLLIGMLAGTYSSIFIASPIWYSLRGIKTAK